MGYLLSLLIIVAIGSVIAGLHVQKKNEILK